MQPDPDTTEQSEQQEYPSCEFYTISNSNNPNRFVVNTQFELYTEFIDDKPIKYQTISTNYLDVLNEPAKMNLNPPGITSKT